MTTRIHLASLACGAVALAAGQASATIMVTGTGPNQVKFSDALTKCTGANVTINAGKLVIGNGGNACAGLLRDMINGATALTADIIAGTDPKVVVGAFNPPITNDADAGSKKSNGTQTLDIDQINNIAVGQANDQFKPTPWGALMHELTEGYTSVRDGLTFNQAHAKGIDAENASYAAEGTGTQRQQDTTTVPAKAPVPRGGGWSIFMPAINLMEPGGMGWWEFDYDVIGGFGNTVPFYEGFFGPLELGSSGLFFEGDQIQLSEVHWVPIPAPSSAALLGAGALLTLRRRR